MSQEVQANIIKTLNLLKNKIEIHNEDITRKQLTLDETIGYYQSNLQAIKRHLSENKIALNLLVKCDEKLKNTLSLIQDNREENTSFRRDDVNYSHQTQLYKSKTKLHSESVLHNTNKKQGEAGLSNLNDITSYQIKTISDIKAKF